MVVLIPADKALRELPGGYRVATTDQYGRFTLKNLTPGDYKAFAWEDVEPGAWMDPEFMKPLDSKGESVTVRESSASNVQLTMIPASAAASR